MVAGQTIKPKTTNVQSRGQLSQGPCTKCGKPYTGPCRLVGSGCFGCGQAGHMSKDCPRRALICFHCNQTNHERVNCPRLSGGAAPATFRITDGHHVKTETPAVKSRAF